MNAHYPHLSLRQDNRLHNFQSNFGHWSILLVLISPTEWEHPHLVSSEESLKLCKLWVMHEPGVCKFPVNERILHLVSFLLPAVNSVGSPMQLIEEKIWKTDCL